MAKKLYVGNLPYTVTDDDLKDMFSQAGTVESATIITDKFSGKSKGFGFVEMATEEEAKKAVEMFDKQTMGERSIIVNEARPMEDRPKKFTNNRRFN